MSQKTIDRIKAVLVENDLSSKWFAIQLGKIEARISRWYTNDLQPSMKSIVKVAEVFK